MGGVDYGLIPYLLTYCKLTNETITAAWRESVMQVLVVVNYEAERIEQENQRLRRLAQK